MPALCPSTPLSPRPKPLRLSSASSFPPVNSAHHRDPTTLCHQFGPGGHDMGLPGPPLPSARPSCEPLPPPPTSGWGSCLALPGSSAPPSGQERGPGPGAQPGGMSLSRQPGWGSHSNNNNGCTADENDSQRWQRPGRVLAAPWPSNPRCDPTRWTLVSAPFHERANPGTQRSGEPGFRTQPPGPPPCSVFVESLSVAFRREEGHITLSV